MKKATVSSFDLPEEDKAWLAEEAAKEIGGSINGTLRKLIKEARLRDERKKKKC